MDLPSGNVLVSDTGGGLFIFEIRQKVGNSGLFWKNLSKDDGNHSRFACLVTDAVCLMGYTEGYIEQ